MGEEQDENQGQEQKVDGELEQLRQEKARLEQELATRGAVEERIHASELARTKAEAELNATRAVLDAQRTGQVSQVTEEQWAALEESTGVSRKAYIANAQIAQQQLEGVKKDFENKLKATEEKYAKSQEQLEKFSRETNSERTFQSLLETKPHLARYKNDVKEFVDMFPEQDKQDPEKLKHILAKAEVWVKGKVGDKMKMNPGSSPRLGAGNEEINEESSGGEFDPVGLQTDAQVRLVRDLNLKNSNDLKERDQQLLKKFQSSDKQGVAYSAETEWAETQAKFGR